MAGAPHANEGRPAGPPPARFDAPADVTLDEFRIELSYPFDAAAGLVRNRADTPPGAESSVVER
jgi:hypothetical protein